MRLVTFLFAVFCLACVEPYEFAVENRQATLVVEGYISDASYKKSTNFPADGRYFTVLLRYAGAVVNATNQVVPHASVSLQSDRGEIWEYTESVDEPGKYLLYYEDFEAVQGRAYKLKIKLPNEETYESEWETLPSAVAPMGSIGFEEVERQVYKVQAGEQAVRWVKGVRVYIGLPEIDSGSAAFYRWNFDPDWIYIAPLAASTDPNYKCWVTSKNYLSNYTLQKDNMGGYRKELAFIETIRNERIFEKLSILVTQQAMSEGFFQFWKEMKERAEGEVLLDIPPYNLQTNIRNTGGAGKASGYFGVVREQASRWYFSKEELSYWVDNPLKADCLVVYKPDDPPAPPCLNCQDYMFGEATTVAPSWWR